MSEPTKEKMLNYLMQMSDCYVASGKLNAFGPLSVTDAHYEIVDAIRALIESGESAGKDHLLGLASILDKEEWEYRRMANEGEPLEFRREWLGVANGINRARMVLIAEAYKEKPAPSPGPSVSYAGRDLSGVKGTPTTVKEYTSIDRTSAAPLPKEVEEAQALGLIGEELKQLYKYRKQAGLSFAERNSADGQAALSVLKAALSKQGPTSKDKIKCPHCQGSGDAAVYTGISETCETCKGTGEVDGPLEDQRLPCPGSKHQPSPPAEPTAGEPATRDIGKAEAVAYFDDLVSWMRKCPIPLPIDEEGIAAIRALILAPPVTVTKEWVESLIATNMPRYVSRAETMLREKGVIVEEKP